MAKPTRYTTAAIENYLQSGLWTITTLSDLWDRNAEAFPDQEAMVDSTHRITWSQGKQMMDRLAAGIVALGVERDRVMVIQLPNCIQLFMLRVACEKAGVLSLHVLMTLRRKEMAYILKYCDAAAVAVPTSYRNFDYTGMINDLRCDLPALKHVLVQGNTIPAGSISIEKMLSQPVKADGVLKDLHKRRYGSAEVSVITLTSGTTGVPKFVEFPFGARRSLATTLATVFKLTHNDILGVFGPAPAGPNCVPFFGAPEVRAKVVLQQHFDPGQCLRLIEKERITVGFVVPAQLAMLLNHPDIRRYDCSSMRLWWCVGAPVPYQIRMDTEKKIGGIVLTGIGAADFGGTTATLMDDPPAARFFTVGKPRGGTEVKIVDDDGREVTPGEVGELWGRGPATSSGYYKDPEATWKAWTRDGWFKMGDLCKFDPNENLLVMGRKKDMIIRGGQNIYPPEIEDLLVSHPSVRDAAVVGMPDPILGERPCAYIVFRAAQTVTFEEIIAFLEEKGIASYKLPERIEIVKELPLLGEQKVNKRLLVQDIDAKLRGRTGLPQIPATSGTN